MFKDKMRSVIGLHAANKDEIKDAVLEQISSPAVLKTKKFRLKHILTACLALVFIIGAGSGIVVAVDAAEYKEAVTYLTAKGISIDNMTRSEIKETYYKFLQSDASVSSNSSNNDLENEGTKLDTLLSENAQSNISSSISGEASSNASENNSSNTSSNESLENEGTKPIVSMPDNNSSLLDPDECYHATTGCTVAQKAPTCHENGILADLVCLDCGSVLVEPGIWPATGIHPYDSKGVCTVCEHVFRPEDYFTFELNKEKDGYTFTGMVGIPYEGQEFNLPEEALDPNRYSYLPNFSVVIPETYNGLPVTRIGQKAFSSVKLKITSVSLPDTVKRIDGSVFSYMPITSFKMPRDLEYLGGQAFFGSSKLTEITFNDKLQFIGVSAFSGTRISSAIIPDSVTEIDSSAFSGCPNLKTVKWPAAITTINNYVFMGSGIEEIVIPEGVEKIEDRVFEGCDKLRSIVLPSTLTSIGSNAFKDCTSLLSITIPDSVTKIENYCFYGCSNLTTVTLPSAITRIEDYTFYECVNLTSINIPASVDFIGIKCFYQCQKLSAVYITELEAWENITYSSSEGANPLYYGATLYLNGVPVN